MRTERSAVSRAPVSIAEKILGLSRETKKSLSQCFKQGKKQDSQNKNMCNSRSNLIFHLCLNYPIKLLLNQYQATQVNFVDSQPMSQCFQHVLSRKKNKRKQMWFQGEALHLFCTHKWSFPLDCSGYLAQCIFRFHKTHL